MVNVAVGAGVLAYPYAFLCTGWLAGSLATCIIASLETYTLIVLARHAELTASTSYGELVSRVVAMGTCRSVLACLADRPSTCCVAAVSPAAAGAQVSWTRSSRLHQRYCLLLCVWQLRGLFSEWQAAPSPSQRRSAAPTDLHSLAHAPGHSHLY